VEQLRNNACFTWARSTRAEPGAFVPRAPGKALSRIYFCASNRPLIVDMDCRTEHLGRATPERLDHLLIVVEPDAQPRHGTTIARLARDIGIRQMSIDCNKVRTADDRQFIEQIAAYLPCSVYFLTSPR